MFRKMNENTVSWWDRLESRSGRFSLLLLVVLVAALSCIAASFSGTWEEAGWRIIRIVLCSVCLQIAFITCEGRECLQPRYSVLLLPVLVGQMLLQVGILKVGERFPDVPAEQLLPVLPYLLSPTIASVMMGRRTGMFAAASAALYGWAFLPVDLSCTQQGNYLIIALAVGLSSAYASGRVHKREQVLVSGMVGGIVSILFAWALTYALLLEQPGTPPLLRCYDAPAFEWMSTLLMIFVVHFMFAALVGGLVPALERVFGIATPMTWLEWADMNRSLLRKMRSVAEGTFHHSEAVQRLAEEAADAIGADSLRAGVCALYHDIGKINAPAYFAENIPDFSESPHNGLTPDGSAKIILKHVTDGVELAKKYRLNKRIIDVIREHHGTSTAYFFYRKAMDEYEEERRKYEEGVIDAPPQEVDKTIYTYKGPIPQSRESGIVSMADAVESAIRSLTKPTAEEITNMVNGIFKGRVLDGHLRDSGLTLGEIETIKDRFVKTCIAMAHVRIKYPKQKSDDSESLADARSTASAEEEKQS